ncbi:hypothetical protein ACFYWN_44565 [Streptomyces sp. NPDC002917]|uniref:hypothetical protein n=1 Tax=Streptomyces sp. NPDC002917 TaxID=3364671 RepID=UPI0036C8DC05
MPDPSEVLVIPVINANALTSPEAVARCETVRGVCRVGREFGQQAPQLHCGLGPEDQQRPDPALPLGCQFVLGGQVLPGAV